MCETLACPLYFVRTNNNWKPRIEKLSLIRNKGWKPFVSDVQWIEKIITLRNEEWKHLEMDTCMINRITMLRNQGIETIGCCCGHGNTLPSIIVKK